MKVRLSHGERECLSRRLFLRGGAAAAAGAAVSQLPLGRLPQAFAQVAQPWPKTAALVRGYVRERKVSGMIAALGWREAPFETVASGAEGFSDDDPVSADTLFRIYSMTKPITGMAAMILIDEGKLALDQPLAEIFPEFAEMRVAIDPAKSLASRPARNKITIRHLLTHTSGLGYSLPTDAVGMELLRLGVVPARVSHLQIPGLTAEVPTPDADEFIRLAASVPLVAEPGTRWYYSMGLDILGLAIAKVSGAGTLSTLLERRIFRPAGMANTFFTVPHRDSDRLATNYGIVIGHPVPIDSAEDSIYLDKPAFAYGGAGLVSTPADYDRFLRMLLGYGELGGQRIMSEAAVRLGMSNLLPEGVSTKGTMAQGGGFGAGGRVGLGVDSGTFGWSGAAGTVAFVNSRIGLRASLFTQYMPNDAYPLQSEFIAAVREDVSRTSGETHG